MRRWISHQNRDSTQRWEQRKGGGQLKSRHELAVVSNTLHDVPIARRDGY